MVNIASIKDAFAGFTFVIEVAGLAEARFTECGGLEAQVEVFEYREGGLNAFVHKLPGRRTFSNVTLKQGFIASRPLWDWIDGVASKKDKSGQRRNISIILYSAAAKEVYRWNLIGAYPVKWTGPAFSTAKAEILIESLELAYDEFTVQAAAG
jgi:phage tail-like protein